MTVSDAGRYAVFGASGSGKSQYVKHALRDRKRLVAFDPMDEYGTRDGFGYVACDTRCETLEEVRIAMRRDWRSFRIAFVPKAGREAQQLSALCKLLKAAQTPIKGSSKGPMLTLAADELNLSFPIHGAVKNNGFAELCSRGRHYWIELWGAAQRISEVSTRFRGNVTETVILRTQGATDVNNAADATGATKDQIKALQNLDYIVARSGKITFGRVPIKAKRRA